MILVLGGTRESRGIIKELANLEEEVIASVATDYSYRLISDLKVEIIRGALEKEGLIDLIKTKNINMIIDATHPFANRISELAIKVSNLLDIDYLRFETKDLKINNDLITKVDSYEEAIESVKDFGKISLMIKQGRISDFMNQIENWQERLFCFTLPTWKIIKEIEEMGMPAENLIAIAKPIGKQLAKAILKEYNISALVIKDCGKQQVFESKIKAAIELEIPVILITRSELETDNIVRESQSMLRLVN